ncbi:hypothetical protein [Novosphingobium jiangmenense]|uniref:Uncharacterized protein n=1 Tax=Novosphingobium jiangmenense TaxID=2791981 RepID=A0ABS0HIT6_9SPHN|nr:hypothetical protein [Novosphingobium jiangmenense]MBF9151896.1 hypothetical protein [Novosphingobium jiangmenense]
MDASILRSVIAKAIGLDTEFGTQKNLKKLLGALNNLTSNPSDPSYQTAFSEAFKEAKLSFAKMKSHLTPGDWDRLEEIGGKQDFDSYIIDKIEDSIQENPATPAVIRDELQEIVSDRDDEIEKYRMLLEGLEHFGIEDPGNDVDHGQVGFKIPRKLFQNAFSVFINELNFLKALMRLISEAQGENPEEIEVGALSTTDPVVWLVVSYGVAKSIGKLTDWALGTWKTVEEIRKIRAETSKLQAFKDEEVEKIFGPKIEEQINLAIKTKVDELTQSLKPAARKNEVRNGLSVTLRQFLARVERGLTVDVRYLPPPQDADVVGDDGMSQTERRMQEIHDVANNLAFKRPAGEPVLRLEAANDQDARP